MKKKLLMRVAPFVQSRTAEEVMDGLTPSDNVQRVAFIEGCNKLAKELAEKHGMKVEDARALIHIMNDTVVRSNGVLVCPNAKAAANQAMQIGMSAFSIASRELLGQSSDKTNELLNSFLEATQDYLDEHGPSFEALTAQHNPVKDLLHKLGGLGGFELMGIPKDPKKLN